MAALAKSTISFPSRRSVGRRRLAYFVIEMVLIVGGVAAILKGCSSASARDSLSGVGVGLMALFSVAPSVTQLRKRLSTIVELSEGEIRVRDPKIAASPFEAFPADKVARSIVSPNAIVLEFLDSTTARIDISSLGRGDREKLIHAVAALVPPSTSPSP